jgi:polyphosphate kinase
MNRVSPLAKCAVKRRREPDINMTQSESIYVNREMSWLEFNQRVLDEASDPSVPLLEQVRFLAITASNLDEFFMVRVGSLLTAIRKGDSTVDLTGQTPLQQLADVSERLKQMVADQHQIYLQSLEPVLAEAGLRRRRAGELNQRQSEFVEMVFDEQLQAAMTPIAVDDPARFPLLFGRTLNVVVQIAVEGGSAPWRFAVIPFGKFDVRVITLPSDGQHEYIYTEDVLCMLAERFFPGEEVVSAVPFRITRNADLSVSEEDGSDLLAEMEDVIDFRKESFCTRLEVTDQANEHVLSFLKSLLRVGDRDIYVVPGPVGLSDISQLADISGFDQYRYPAWKPCPAPDVDPAESIFDTIRARDVLLYHPYESFDPVVRLVEEAAEDRDVVAIKQTLYRTTRNSPIVRALMQAAENGKNVTVIVELKARFDEARNIEWARQLEYSGVQVIYGVRGLKTHAKCCVVVRREPQGFQRYAHFGTGNYNEISSRFYTDVSYMTCNRELGNDAIAWFNAVTGASQVQQLTLLESAPIGLREKLLDLIAVETRRARNGDRAKIMIKLNSLADQQLIDALYEASQAGVEIQLNIRGICCLRPGVPGLSENIRVTSIIDRFLEHARIAWFYHGGDERVFISSADWMPRNLDRRVELLVPILEESCKRRVIDILRICLRDNTRARRLTPDGKFVPPKSNPARPSRCQLEFQRLARDAADAAVANTQTTFTPVEPRGRS